LTVLSLFNNPIEQQPLYRHLVVNSVASLLLLDFHLVADEECIEGAAFGAKYGAGSETFEVCETTLFAMTTYLLYTLILFTFITNYIVICFTSELHLA